MRVQIHHSDDDEKLAKARELRASGLGWKSTADRIGRGEDWLRRRIDPDYNKAKNNRERSARRRLNEKYRAGIKVLHIAHIGPRQADIAARLAEIPPDTRDFTQRFCGDPLPLRSALAKKMNGAQA